LQATIAVCNKFALYQFCFFVSFLFAVFLWQGWIRHLSTGCSAHLKKFPDARGPDVSMLLPVATYGKTKVLPYACLLSTKPFRATTLPSFQGAT
jgi:hypothetical protein